MKLLIIGGTGFIGSHIIQEALKHNYKVTIFNRGLTNNIKYSGIQQIKGDRNTIKQDGDSHSLVKAINLGQKWDYIIDCCGYHDTQIAQLLPLIGNSKYVFLSTCSVYSTDCKSYIDERSTLVNQENHLSSTSYQKVLCERAIINYYSTNYNNYLILRLGLVVGNLDHTDRLGYWIRKSVFNKKLLVPEYVLQPIQFIYVKDLVRFLFHCIRHNKYGIYNVNGPKKINKKNNYINNISIQELLATIIRITNSQVTIKLIPETTLLKENIKLWSNIPLCLGYRSNSINLMNIDYSKAIKAGLQHTNLSEVILESMDWYLNNIPSGAWLSELREQQILDKWGHISADINIKLY